MFNFARNLILTSGELLHGLPQRCQTLRYLLDLFRVDRGGEGRFRRDRLRRSLRNGCHLRRLQRGRPNGNVFGTRQWLRPTKLLDPARDHLFGFRRPAKLWGAGRDDLLGRLAVGLPGQSASDTNADRNQVTNESSRNSPSRQVLRCSFRLAILY